MFTREEIQDYRCPRWNDWPKLDLYMDQAVSLIEENVAIFYADCQPKPVTSTMINNYVKQKIVPPSRKKKYGRDHLACLYTIFLLKSALNLTDISEAIMFINNRDKFEGIYNVFCDEVEYALAITFGGEPREAINSSEDRAVIRTIAMAFAYTLLARYQIASV